MSNGTVKKIDLHAAHKALGDLLKELETVDETKLTPRGSTTPNPIDWLNNLKKAHKALPEWCDGFMFEGPSKR